MFSPTLKTNGTRDDRSLPSNGEEKIHGIAPSPFVAIRSVSIRREVVTLHGRVQMVGYRERVIEIARRYAVAGTVRNLRTGQLEVDAEGEDEALTAFLTAVTAERPPLARIDGAQRRHADPRGLKSFDLAPSA